LAKVTFFEADLTQHKQAQEVGILRYPGCSESSVFGLTELFVVANRFIRLPEDAQTPVTRVSHWQASEQHPRRIERVFDTHPGRRQGAFRILIAPASIARPISRDESAPFAKWLARHHHRGSLVTSVCGGAFLLAEANLLNGRTVTTHWYYADALRERYPAVTVDADRILIDDGDIITAGGMTAWTDLGIRLIHRTMGTAIAAQTARFMLLDSAAREQSFYSSFLPRLEHGDSEILKVQHWLQRNGCRNVDLNKMAKVSGLGLRTFIRRFQKATALKPTEYCQRLRIGKAREMLESTRRSVEQISWTVGYEDPASFRKVFHKIVGLSPREYRNRFTFDALREGS
jgi:transcriptional regulator GlxA family with amidase domain